MYIYLDDELARQLHLITHHTVWQYNKKGSTPMNSTLLLLNSLALAVLVVFHFQGSGSDDMAPTHQTASHHTQQRPQLAVMSMNDPAPTRLTHATPAVNAGEHWVF